MNAPLICPVHGVPMEPRRHVDLNGEKRARLRGACCTICAAKAAVRIKAAQAIHRRYHTSHKRRVLPPAPTVMMPRD